MFFALLNLFSITINQLNECYINKQVAYFKSVGAIDVYTSRDYRIYDGFLDVAEKNFGEAIHSPEKCSFCYRCDDNLENCYYYNYTPEERGEMFVMAMANYLVYSFRTMKKIIPCPVKNDYYFDYR